MDRTSELTVDRLTVEAYRVPTEAPESDGTFEWSATTLVLVSMSSGGEEGIGYTYADVATAQLIEEHLAEVVLGRDPLAISGSWSAMLQAVRNVGRPGIASMGISAVDAALWDLKARLLGVPLVRLLGVARDAVPVYGSGGFTSLSIDELQRQLGDWAARGMRYVKMKVGREPASDERRARAARNAIGDEVELFVDANGAYTRKQALAMAARFGELHVTWFEEPVSSDDLDGLRMLRDRAPPGMAISAGEYGYDSFYFRRMLAAEAVDVLQADATRCAGVTGFLNAAALCEAHAVPLSSHCAPSLHLPACCAALPVAHLEHFHDHARIEQMLFDGARTPEDGMLRPDLSASGLGLVLKRADANRFKVFATEHTTARRT